MHPLLDGDGEMKRQEEDLGAFKFIQGNRMEAGRRSCEEFGFRSRDASGMKKRDGECIALYGVHGIISGKGNLERG